MDKKYPLTIWCYSCGLIGYGEPTYLKNLETYLHGGDVGIHWLKESIKAGSPPIAGKHFINYFKCPNCLRKSPYLDNPVIHVDPRFPEPKWRFNPWDDPLQHVEQDSCTEWRKRFVPTDMIVKMTIMYYNAKYLNKVGIEFEIRGPQAGYMYFL